MGRTMNGDNRELIPCYVGRDTCGCIVSCMVDDPNNPHRKTMLKEIKKFCRETLRDGLTLDRSTVGAIRGGALGHKCGKE